MRKLFTSESVTEGHPDKLCDYISDTILDECLKQDPNSRVAVETFAFKNIITVAGQLTTTAKINIEELVRQVVKEIGYDNEKTDMDYKTCKVNIEINKQSPDIAMGVDIGGWRPRDNVWICMQRNRGIYALCYLVST